jgi:hypothetical protein
LVAQHFAYVFMTANYVIIVQNQGVSMKKLKRDLWTIVTIAVFVTTAVFITGCTGVGTTSQPTSTIKPGESVAPSSGTQDISDTQATPIGKQTSTVQPTTTIKPEESVTPSATMEDSSDTQATSVGKQTPTATAKLPMISTNTVSPYNSGLKGVTSTFVASGVPGGGMEGGPASIEFAIAPVKDDGPEFSQAIFVTSDEQGKYEVALPVGKYWIGPKDKALNPETFYPTVSFTEVITDVTEGVFTEVDLTRIAYAP